MKRKTLLLILGLLLTFNCYAGQVETYLDYIDGSVVTDVNLDGNFNLIRNELNGGLDNYNIDTANGYRLYEILSSIPAYATQGRMVFNKADNTLNMDTSASWITVATTLSLNSKANKGANSDITSISGLTTALAISQGGTGQTTAQAAIDALLPSQASANGKYLTSDGTNSSWGTITAVSPYFEPDSLCVLGYNGGLKTLQADAVTLTALTEADLVTGQISTYGQCYDFDGSTEYAIVTEHVAHSGMTALTIEVWVYKDTAGTQIILGVTTNSKGYILTISDTQIGGSIYTDSGDEVWAVNHASGDFTGAWHYVVITWDSSSAANIYLDGTDIGDGDNAGNGAVLSGMTGIRIGVNSAGTNLWDGKIDGLRISRYKMTAAEVLARYNAFN